MKVIFHLRSNFAICGRRKPLMPNAIWKGMTRSQVRLHFRNSLYRWNLELGRKWSRCDYKWEIFHPVQKIGKLCHHFMHININFGSLRFIGSSSKSFWVRILENLSLVSHLESLELDLEILAHEFPGDVVLPPVRGDRQVVHWGAGPDQDHLVSGVGHGDASADINLHFFLMLLRLMLLLLWSNSWWWGGTMDRGRR